MTQVMISLLWLACGALLMLGCDEASNGGRAGDTASDGDPVPPDVADTLSPAPGGDAAGDGGGGGHGAMDSGSYTPSQVERGEAIFRDTCAACHTMGRGPTRRGPDLLTVALKPDNWLRQWIDDPAGWAAQNPYAARLIETWGRTMPDLGLDAADTDAVIAFLRAQQAIGPLAPRAPVTLTDDAAATAQEIYFDRCAGCHGTRRGGGTGPDISTEPSVALGTDTLRAVIGHGTPWGMPAWGDDATLDDASIDQLAAFLQLPVPEAPTLGFDAIHTTWEVLVPVAERPTAPLHARAWEDFFGVVLRDSGVVVVLDGGTKEELARIDVGRATHILRASASGRYFTAVGRDGWVTLIDLWSATPTAVARVRGCYDARSVEASRHAGYEDRFLVEGCYWPPQYVVFDGATLEPLAVHEVPKEVVGTGEVLDEVRVAAIVSSRFAPEWALSLKEAGVVAFVDYAQPGFPIVAKVGAERFLHDGGLDHSGRYFLAAANASNRMVVIDLQTRALVASFETGGVPHPGRGANWQDPVHGWINATPHLGAPLLSIYGADPAGNPADAWRVVREVALPSSGSLFVKTHPASPWVFVDMTLSDDPIRARQLCVYAKASGALDRCIDVATRGRVVHPEFNRDGSELWVSVWDEQGELVVYDAVTLAELTRIPGLATPTGKFNVHNTAHDVY